MAGFPSILDSALRNWIKHDPAPSTDQRKSRGFLKLASTSPSPPKNSDHAAELAKMVEAEIIPRLMLAHSAAPVDGPTEFGDATTDVFAKMVLSKDSDSLISYVGTLLQSGISMETIYVELMMPAARKLGDYWDEDSISFADVTIGLGRLQQVVRTIGWQRPRADGNDHAAPSALFLPATREQHTFGLFIIEDSFRRAGWRTWIETSGLDEDAIDMAGHHWFDLVGLSASTDAQVDRIGATIAAIRKASRNPGVFILVGGRLFIESPELVLEVGADATAPDGADALLIANKAVRRLASNA